mmetsp:Transcript_42832/g.101123  ORF Transcript_42832/g.101123 Transcript_42832/m.101123 type:complete len:218 (+) Transcript_42832:1279-1932(+)
MHAQIPHRHQPTPLHRYVLGVLDQACKDRSHPAGRSDEILGAVAAHCKVAQRAAPLLLHLRLAPVSVHPRDNRCHCASAGHELAVALVVREVLEGPAARVLHGRLAWELRHRSEDGLDAAGAGDGAEVVEVVDREVAQRPAPLLLHTGVRAVRLHGTHNHLHPALVGDDGLVVERTARCRHFLGTHALCRRPRSLRIQPDARAHALAAPQHALPAAA